MKSIVWLWSIVVFILLFSWVVVGQNTPASNPFNGSITVSPGAPFGSLSIATNGAVSTIGSLKIPLLSKLMFRTDGVADNAGINEDSSGSLVFSVQTTSGRGFAFSNGGTPIASISAIAPANSLVVGSGGALQFSALKSTTGTRYLCVDTAGNVTASATACSGT